MPTQVSFSLAGSHRTSFTLRMSTNPFSASGGPLPRLNIPLEARLTDQDIEVDILRFLFDLKLGNVVIGQGEIGSITHVSTSERYFTAVATCPREALPYLFNPQPSQGRLTLELDLGGLVRYRHQLPEGDERAYGLGDAGVWHIESIGEKGTHHRGFRSRAAIGSSKWSPSSVSAATWSHRCPAVWPTRLEVHARSPRPGGAGHYSDGPASSVRPLPGGARRGARSKQNIFDTMPEGKKRDAINELTKRTGEYIHSGRHVVPGTASEQGGEFPVDQRDALFVYNTTKLLITQIYGLVSHP